MGYANFARDPLNEKGYNLGALGFSLVFLLLGDTVFRCMTFVSKRKQLHPCLWIIWEVQDVFWNAL